MRRARRGRPVDRLQGIVATMKACSLCGLRMDLQQSRIDSELRLRGKAGQKVLIHETSLVVACCVPRSSLDLPLSSLFVTDSVRRDSL